MMIPYMELFFFFKTTVCFPPFLLKKKNYFCI